VRIKDAARDRRLRHRHPEQLTADPADEEHPDACAAADAQEVTT
jgi:hypothetical protein